MHSLKKVNSDLFLLILLIVRLGLQPDIYINNRWNRGLESRSVFLGPTSAYTQISFHPSYSSDRYPHPKSVEYNEIDGATSLFSRLNFYDTLRAARSNLIACIANSPHENNEQCHDNRNFDSNNGDRSLQTDTGSPLQVIGGASSTERNAPLRFDTVDLSREDMDLIEILWKQDIDLGVSRDAYDTRQNQEIEKLKEIELAKKKEFYRDTDDKPCSEATPVPDPFAGLNYTIDSETGEYLFEGFSELNDEDIPDDQLLENDTKFLNTELLSENETLGALTQDSYLPFDDNDDFCDLSDALTPAQLMRLLNDDISIDSDYLSQIEDLEKELEQFETLNDSTENDPPAGEMYPSMEDCWPDTTTMLPLLALSSSHQASLAPISSHPIHSYSSLGNNNNISLTLAPENRPNENFIGLLQSASMEVPSTDEEFQPTSMSSTVGPSSIGCAVAESMATLTNDTDPLPTSSIAHSVYSSEFPELLYSNHTVAAPHSQLLMSDLILDEELHLVNLPSNGNEEKRIEDHMETSSDSISLTSGQLPSVSDYQEWMDSCSETSSHHGERDDLNRCNSAASNPQSSFNQHQNFESIQNGALVKKLKNAENKNEIESHSFSDVPFEQVNCNDQQYYTLKPYYPDVSESCGNGKSSFAKKFDYAIPKPIGVNSSNFLHHNHSYHLPFTNNESRCKPITRDKSKYLSEEDASNKDEKKAKELKLPISINDIINMAIEVFNERLSKYELTEAQLTLIRDIRRRGKNKVAAQNCRKRKMDQISSLQQDLGFLQREKLQLRSKHNHLLQEKHHFEDKYSQLYDLVLQNTNSKPPNPPTDMLVHRGSRITYPTKAELTSEDDPDSNRGARTKRKYKK